MERGINVREWQNKSESDPLRTLEGLRIERERNEFILSLTQTITQLVCITHQRITLIGVLETERVKLLNDHSRLRL